MTIKYNCVQDQATGVGVITATKPGWPDQVFSVRVIANYTVRGKFKYIHKSVACFFLRAVLF